MDNLRHEALTLKELECALEIDLKDRFPRLGRGHQDPLWAARDCRRGREGPDDSRNGTQFLLDEGLDSEFAVCQTEALPGSPKHASSSSAETS